MIFKLSDDTQEGKKVSKRQEEKGNLFVDECEHH